MLQEIHHRVKNNLQVIASLINMQMRSLDDAGSKVALEECKTRVHAIALIHETIYRARDYARVPFSEYAKTLARRVVQATGLAAHAVDLRLAVDELSLPVDQAIPCGLILNELVTNALKHAFPNGRHGSICVELARLEQDRLRLAVRDDGVGLPGAFDIGNSSSVGLQLVATLAEQLTAALEVSSEAGAAFVLTFAIHPDSPHSAASTV
jgi:two-component sensor histidine kinase